MARRADDAGDLAVFRAGLYGCFTARADALMDLTDAVLCADGPVRSAELSLCPVFRVVENGVGISCAPSRSGRPCFLEADQLATAGRRLFGAGQERPAHRSAPRSCTGESAGIRIVHMPYVVEMDEDGVWCADAQLRPGSGR
jgi:hypothetical protein